MSTDKTTAQAYNLDGISEQLQAGECTAKKTKSGVYFWVVRLAGSKSDYMQGIPPELTLKQQTTSSFLPIELCPNPTNIPMPARELKSSPSEIWDCHMSWGFCDNHIRLKDDGPVGGSIPAGRASQGASVATQFRNELNGFYAWRR